MKDINEKMNKIYNDTTTRPENIEPFRGLSSFIRYIFFWFNYFHFRRYMCNEMVRWLLVSNFDNWKTESKIDSRTFVFIIRVIVALFVQFLKVFFVDIGIIEDISRSEIFELIDDELLQYGPLAINVQIHGLYRLVYPIDKIRSILMHHQFGIRFSKWFVDDCSLSFVILQLKLLTSRTNFSLECSMMMAIMKSICSKCSHV